jgi:Zn-dependent protease with chaperone function
MLAHEIGHILDKTQRLPNNQLTWEYNADQLAIDLGLSQELKSGLEKIIKSGDYSNENLDIKKRIKKLS